MLATLKLPSDIKDNDLIKAIKDYKSALDIAYNNSTNPKKMQSLHESMVALQDLCNALFTPNQNDLETSIRAFHNATAKDTHGQIALKIIAMILIVVGLCAIIAGTGGAGAIPLVGAFIANLALGYHIGMISGGAASILFSAGLYQLGKQSSLQRSAAKVHAKSKLGSRSPTTGAPINEGNAISLTRGTPTKESKADDTNGSETAWDDLTTDIAKACKTLGVDQSKPLSKATLKKAFNEFALLNHPDKARMQGKSIKDATKAFQDGSNHYTKIKDYLDGKAHVGAQTKPSQHCGYDDDVLQQAAKHLSDIIHAYLNPMGPGVHNNKRLTDRDVWELLYQDVYQVAATYVRNGNDDSVLTRFFRTNTNALAKSAGGRDCKFNGLRNQFLYLLFAGDFPNINLFEKNADGKTIADIILTLAKEGAYTDNIAAPHARAMKLHQLFHEVSSMLATMFPSSSTTNESPLSDFTAKLQLATKQKPLATTILWKSNRSPLQRASADALTTLLKEPIQKLSESDFIGNLASMRGKAYLTLKEPFGNEAFMDRTIGQFEAAKQALLAEANAKGILVGGLPRTPLTSESNPAAIGWSRKGAAP